ncbi:MAG: hypothetical protein QOF41_964 [Methylobacteriaceae bacterium]|nr:hypothetical protein [Methylobacteriaceae bacterium]
MPGFFKAGAQINLCGLDFAQIVPSRAGRGAPTR